MAHMMFGGCVAPTGDDFGLWKGKSGGAYECHGEWLSARSKEFGNTIAKKLHLLTTPDKGHVEKLQRLHRDLVEAEKERQQAEHWVQRAKQQKQQAYADEDADDAAYDAACDAAETARAARHRQSLPVQRKTAAGSTTRSHGK